VFLEDIHIKKVFLKTIDFRQFSNLTDKMIIKFYMYCLKLNKLKLPFSSNITSDSIITINTYQKNITHLIIKTKNYVSFET
jgi:hypothetical protein